MRKKLQDTMFETSCIFEFLISLIVGIGILAFGVKMIIDMSDFSVFKDGVNGLMGVLAFALAKQLIVGHSEPWMNLITVVAIAILFAIRRFLLIGHDMVETPDGLIEKEMLDEIRNEE